MEEAVRIHIKLFLDNKTVLEELNKTQQAAQLNAGRQREIEDALKRKKRAEKMFGSLYNDYADGLLSERDYLYAKEKYLKQAAEEEQRLSELQEMQRRHETGCRGKADWILWFSSIGILTA